MLWLTRPALLVDLPASMLMSAPTDEATTWLPIAAAAPRLGLSAHGLKTRVRRDTLPARKDNRGRLLVAVPTSMLTSASMTAPTSAPMSTPTDQLDSPDEIERWRSATEAARLEAAQAKGELAGLRVALATVEAERDRLAADLALARKSWLERVLEAVRR